MFVKKGTTENVSLILKEYLNHEKKALFLKNIFYFAVLFLCFILRKTLQQITPIRNTYVSIFVAERGFFFFFVVTEILRSLLFVTCTNIHRNESKIINYTSNKQAKYFTGISVIQCHATYFYLRN
jgi:hypothetical protein